MSFKSSPPQPQFQRSGAPRSHRPASLRLPIALAVFVAAWQIAPPLVAQEVAALKRASDSEPVQLSKLVVSENQASSGGSTVIAGVPGGTNLVDDRDFANRRIGNIADALAFQPGVFAASVFGGESVRLSIRGSGIQRGPTAWAQGVQTFFDGLSVTDANGTPYESFEPLAVDRLEIFRGANAFPYSPISLGGAINYVTKTGYTAAPFQARFEAGSFGYYRAQLSSGAVQGKFDDYVSVTGFKLEGYRRVSEAHSVRLVANFGYRFTPAIETRLIVRYAEQEQQTSAGTLTLGELRADPRQSSPATPYVAARVNKGSSSIGLITTWKLEGDANLAFRLQNKRQPVENTGGDAVHNIGGPSQYKNSAVVGSLEYDRADTLGGLPSHAQAAFYFTQTDDSSGKTQRADLSRQSEVSYGGSDYSFVIVDDLKLTPKLTATTGLAAVDQKRVSVIVFPTPAFGGSAKPDYFGYAPRFGLRYEATPKLEVFANVSRSFEAPININYARATAAPITNYPLRQQKANSYEVGARGTAGILEWNVGYYYSAVKDELLSSSVQLEAPPILPVVVTANSSPTIHQGLEAGFSGNLWRGVKGGGPSGRGERLVLRGSYTYSDFHFVADPLYRSNILPAVPRHQLQSELLLESGSGFYAAVNARAIVRRYPVDFANTIWAQPYTVFGARVGYARPAGRWTVFLDADNLTDKRYASSVAVLADARGIDARNYYPGLGFNFTSGFSLRF